MTTSISALLKESNVASFESKFSFILCLLSSQISILGSVICSSCKKKKRHFNTYRHLYNNNTRHYKIDLLFHFYEK